MILWGDMGPGFPLRISFDFAQRTVMAYPISDSTKANILS